jgi:hypothetical protein
LRISGDVRNKKFCSEELAVLSVCDGQGEIAKRGLLLLSADM